MMTIEGRTQDNTKCISQRYSDLYKTTQSAYDNNTMTDKRTKSAYDKDTKT